MTYMRFNVLYKPWNYKLNLGEREQFLLNICMCIFVKLSVLLREWKVYFAKHKNGLVAPGGSGWTPQLTRNSHLAPQSQNCVWQNIFSILETTNIV